MVPLALDDLLPLEDYVVQRQRHVAAQARYLERYRRVRVGPEVMLTFENRQTLWFRIQELLRVARLSEPAPIQRELDLYNRLLPARDRLQAALMVDLPDGPDWTAQFQFWNRLPEAALTLQVDSLSIPARFVNCRPEDRCDGTTRWVEFAVAGEARTAFADRRRMAVIAIEHQDYRRHSAPLSDAIRQSLLDDLALSDRDRAA